MIWLIVVTLIWAFSFSLIGVYLAGQVDGYFAVLVRMLLATLLFLPLLKIKQFTRQQMLRLMGIGAIQIGIMYLFFYHSFLYLSVPEVLLFTIFTPIYVTLFDDLINLRKLSTRWVIPAVLSVIGAAIIRYQSVSDHFLLGFLLIQAANICFAFGQIAYKRLPLGETKQQHQVFAFFFIGATLVAFISWLMFGSTEKLPETPQHFIVLGWLGLVASGLGYWMWNIGTKRVNTGQLATMNNALIPAGLLVNFAFWQTQVQWSPLLLGGTLIVFSVVLASKSRKPITGS